MSPLDAIRRHVDCVSAVELILKSPLDKKTLAILAEIREQLQRPLFISKFWSASGQSKDGKQIKLLVDHGFDVVTDEQAGTIQSADLGSAADGIVFRIARTTPASSGIAAAVALAHQQGLRAQVHLRLANDSPAMSENDEWSNIMRMLEGALCGLVYRHDTIFLDTFSDVDRGYFPRIGLVDRRFNPRLGNKLLRTLHGVMLPLAAELTGIEWCECDEALVAVLSRTNSPLAVVIPRKHTAVETLRALLQKS